jgi:hypothetical protein
MNKIEFENTMVDLASKEHSVDGGQPVFEFVWEFVDILFRNGYESTIAKLITIPKYDLELEKNEEHLYLKFEFRNPKLGSVCYLIISGNETEEECIFISYDISYVDLESKKEWYFSVCSVLFALVDKEEFIDEFEDDIFVLESLIESKQT